MNDVERLLTWMKERNLNIKQMAREMRMPYQTVYHAVTVRGEKAGNDTITGSFIVRFTATYGFDEATKIFSEYMMAAA